MKSSSIARLLLATTSAYALICAGTLAQDAAHAENQASAADSSITEVIVTAQHRKENVQKTPIVVNVLTAKDLAQSGATDVTRIGELVPSVHVATSALGGAQVAVRGIVNNNVNVGSDPSLAMSVDDVYIARAQAALSSIYDVSRVEILKGPQGTLYGRNSISGAMNIVTNDPSHHFGGNLSADLSNYNSHIVEGALNIPLGTAVALRVAGQSVKHDGYVDHFWGDDDRQAVRVKLLADLNENTQLVLSASIFKLGGVGGLSVNLPYGDPSDPWNPGQTNNRSGAKLDDTVKTYSGKFTWHNDLGTLTYIRGYMQFDEDYNQAPSFPLSVLHRWGVSKQNTDEVRFTSSTAADAAGKLAWVVGAFNYNEDQTQFRHVEALLPFGALVQDAGYPNVHAQSFAVFAQGTYALRDHLRVTLGVRSTDEAKSAVGSNDTTLAGHFSSTPTKFEQSSSKVSYKLGVEGDVAANSLAYASITTSFHGGGWQDGATPADSTYKPEDITSYEIGLKNEFDHRRLRFNIGAYYYDYKNFLVSVSDRLSPTCACFVNAPKATAFGVESETQFLLTPDDRFSLNVAYEDTDYKDFKFYEPYYTTGITGHAIPATATSPAGTDLSGTEFPFVSKISGNAAYQHSFHLSNGGTVTASVNSQFRSRYYASLANNAAYRQKGYTKSDLNVTYASPANWSLSAYVRNLEKAPAVSQFGTPFGGGPGPNNVALGTPQTYGVRLATSF